MFGASLGKRVNDLVGAVENRDDERFFAALQGVARATPKARRDEVQAALGRLVPVLEQIPFGMGGDLAQLAGSMADYGTDPAVVVPTLVNRATGAMEQAARFEQLHRAAFGAVPDAEDPAQIESTLERFVSSAAERGMTEQDAAGLVEAWFCGGQWVQPVLYLSQRKDVRAMLPERPRLTAAIDATREQIGTAHWLYGLLLVLDEEPLIVLHRATGRGFRVTISGIGDNFQLHTLLAAALIGDESRGMLPGQRPSAAEIAAASDCEDLTPPGGIRGNFNLVDAAGEWIWNEGRPADIPKLEGMRVVVVDPPPYQRTWNAGRPYPLMRPTVTVHGPLRADEAARWLSLVKPSQRG
ncbi:hypothetical protein [Micromonospora sp. IBHARD004]|uniref:hypothetical protein n=1 Tax=Micromonospora sp. IBHARD004 TaxID=3457764 RepID=UPI0040582A4F